MAVFVFILAILAGAVIVGLLAAVVAWNVTDIVNVGANFWNVFWLGLVAMIVLASSSASKS